MGDKLFLSGEQSLDYRGALSEWRTFIAQYLATNEVTHVMLLGEQRPYHKIAIDEANRVGVQVYVTDFGYIRPDWLIIERDGMNALSRFPRTGEEILRLAKGVPAIDRTLRYPDRFAVQARWDMAFHLSQVYWPFRFPHYERHSLVHPFLYYSAIGWRLLLGKFEKRAALKTIEALRGKRVFVFAMQTEDDYSIRAYSPYPDMEAPMRETIQSFAQNATDDTHLVFKLHPLDPGLKRWRKRVSRMAEEQGNPSLAARVHFIDGGDLDSLLRDYAGLITVNSTVGVRALELGCATKALGDAVYRVEGLTHETSLESFWHAPTKPDPILADAFIRALAATVHVRGSMYNHAGIEAAAKGMAHRIANDAVNVPLQDNLAE
jgi:capsular polysaccharide export protein